MLAAARGSIVQTSVLVHPSQAVPTSHFPLRVDSRRN